MGGASPSERPSLAGLHDRFESNQFTWNYYIIIIILYYIILSVGVKTTTSRGLIPKFTMNRRIVFTMHDCIIASISYLPATTYDIPLSTVNFGPEGLGRPSM